MITPHQKAQVKKALEEAKRRNMNNLHAARKALSIVQPTALYIRLEMDKCPDCKRTGGFVSYQLPEDLPGGEWYQARTDGYENCGFYCTNCQWGNAGSRKVEE